jgi:NTP pyrophosphatase (non-canonical NTP hydrolase)
MDKSKTIRELTDAMNHFVEAMGWYRPDSPFVQSPRNIAISLSLEAAEVLEHFQWGEEADAEALEEELADVMLYLLQLAYLTGVNLGDAVTDKLAVNYRRFGAGSSESPPAHKAEAEKAELNADSDDQR